MSNQNFKEWWEEKGCKISAFKDETTFDLAWQAYLQGAEHAKSMQSLNTYKGEIVHFIGGAKQYIGELDTNEHPNGPNWYRIKRPCVTFQRMNEAEKRLENVIADNVGTNKAYRNFVDFRIPPDSIIEITILDKNGAMYKFYHEEINRVKRDRIVAPGDIGLKLPGLGAN